MALIQVTDNTTNQPVQLKATSNALNVTGSMTNTGPLGDQLKAASLSVTPATDIPCGRYIGGNIKGFKFLQTFTRPSDSTPYSPLDSINAVTTPVVMSQDLAAQGAVASGFLVITNARVISSVKGSGLNVNVCIFPATFTATADNSELSIDDTTAALGGVVIPCPNYYTFAVNGRCVSDPSWWEMQLAAASTTIYVVLQAQTAYTPASGEVFTVILEGFFL